MVDNPVATGDEAMSRGEWAEARDSYQRAVEADPSSAAAWQGLGWAAWWLEDDELCLDAREQAFRAFRAAGDACGASRSASWLATDHMGMRGDQAVALGWFQRARSLLEGQDECPDHGYLALAEAHFELQFGGSPIEGERRADQAIRIGREFGVPDLEAVGRGLKGKAALNVGRVEEGARLLDEASAIATADEFEFALSPMWTLCCAITGCERIGDFSRAAQWAGSMVAMNERWPGRYMTGVCRTSYGNLLAAQGDWPAGEATLTAAVNDLKAARPLLAAEGLVRLGELRARQGRREEAAELFREATTHPGGQVGLGGLALAAGDCEGAADSAERVLRRLPEGALLDRVPALELLARARAGLGSADEAAAACGELAEIADALGTPYLRGRARAAEGELAARAGEHGDARRLYEDAIDLFAESAAPYEEARARMMLAEALVGLGRVEAADSERSRAETTLARLGAANEASPRPGGAAAEPGLLTTRELDVLRLVAEGLTNEDIAERLIVSPHTVHRHVANIRMKLGLSSRAAAAAYATREHLI